MSQSVNLQEMAITIAVQKNNPTILAPDFLKYTGIVPSEWELAREPVRNNSVAQVTFQNGISIVSQFNRIIFSEVIATKEPQDIEVNTIARRYVEKLSQAQYQGIGINFGGYVLFAQSEQASRDFILNNLLQPGPWSEFGNAPVQAAMKFSYTLEGKQLNLEVNQAAIKFPDKKLVPAVLFSGNFNYSLSKEGENNQVDNIVKAIAGWQTDLDTYKEVVNTKFFNPETSSDSYEVKIASDNSLVFPN
ncbi:hypothetical protein [Calothrix rhizosoleniae]|uniref:hypothetical protein n=1 Tax=Calothrix rhizosoleniae TaxID=888997 RepID=UPI001177D7DD|nr:hypothetical protein [Calothrix rhizosoleniae]